MKKPHRSTVRFFAWILVIEVGVVALAILLFASTSQAHTARPVACELAWQQAPPGQKWTAQQRCVAAQRRHNCVTHTRRVPGYVKVKGLRLSPGRSKRNSVHWRNQRKVVGWVVNEGLRRNLKRTIVLSALVAGTQESSLRELDYGHGTSLGPWQLISDHGTPKQRKSVEFSGNWYFNGALKEWRRLGPMSAPTLAQEVEESAFPSAYAEWLPESTATLDAVLGTCLLPR